MRVEKTWETEKTVVKTKSFKLCQWERFLTWSPGKLIVKDLTFVKHEEFLVVIFKREQEKNKTSHEGEENNKQ